MTDWLRGGSFGGPGFGPFKTGGGDFSKYDLGGMQSEQAQLDKYAASVAWNNGMLSDEGYVHALAVYLGTTEKGSRERIAATDELADVRYTIGRNTRVRTITNDSVGTGARISGWNDLISFDRAHLSTMTQDNQQWAELSSRIAQEQGHLRKEGWAALVARYNNGHVTTQRMLSAARRLAAQSAGGPDHADWAKQVTDFVQRGLGEQQATLEYAYKNAKPGAAAAAGKAVLSFLDGRLGTMDQTGPAYITLARYRDQWAQKLHTNEVTARDSAMDQSYQLGHVTDDAYLAYYQKRATTAPSGSDEQRSMRAKLLSVAFSTSENRARGVFTKTGDPSQLIDVYLGAQAGMTRGSAAWTNLNAQIASLQADAYKTFSLLAPAGALGAGYSPGGHLIGPGNFGAPVGANGFASQFDGSSFGSGNCMYAAAAMLAWSAGVTGQSGGSMRWYSGDTGSGGMLSDVGHAFGQIGLGLDQQAGLSVDAFRRKLLNGQGALVVGIYGNLSGAYRLSDFSGGHGVYVDSAKKGADGRWYYYVMDPIGRSAAAGARWWSEDALKAFGWSGQTNPFSGTRSFGNVAFAVGRGRSRTVNHGAVPFQAFDTDANGRSTVGQGGGTNRTEAGYRPPGWGQKPSAGVTGTPATGKKTEAAAVTAASGPSSKGVALAEFMGALSRVGGKGTMLALLLDPQTPAAEDAFRAKAAAALAAGGGDPRLSAIAFFLGQPANPDTATWTDNQRFYANGVGSQYGSPTVPKGGIGVIDPKAPVKAEPAPPPAEAGTPGVSPAAASAGQAAGTEAQPPMAAPSTAGEAIATRFLAGIGAKDTPDNRRAVIAMLEAQFGNTPMPLNPFGLKTTGPNDLPGQTGLRDGWAVFANPGAGVDAAAADMVRNPRYALLLGAFRRGDPKAIADQLPTSGWDDAAFAGNRFAHAYNKPEVLGSGTPLFPEVSQLNTPSSMADLSTQEPSIEMLVNGDPTDPVWKVWYDGNRDAILDAEKRGHSSWTFTRPDGTPVSLPFDRGLAVDIADSNYQHATVLSGLARQAGNIDASETYLTDAAKLLTGVTMQTAGDVLGNMDQLAQDRMAKGDAYGAALIYNGEMDFLYIQVAGAYAPGSTIAGRTRQLVRAEDLTSAMNPNIDLDQITRWTDARSDPTSAAGALLGLMEPDAKGVAGFTADGSVNPNRAYWTQVRNGSTGRMEMLLVSDRQNPDAFVPEPVVDPATGSPTGETVPKYRNPDHGLIPVVLSTGGVAYQPIVRTDTEIAVYANQPVSPAKTVGPVAGGRGGVPVGTGAVMPSGGPGPLEMRPSTQVVGLRTFQTADPADDGPNQRTLTWYSVDGKVWVGVPAGEAPVLVSNVKGVFTQDAATHEMLLDGKPVKPADYAGMFTFYGLQDGADPYGKAGVGSPGRRHPVRIGDARGGVDAALQPWERAYQGGDQWTKLDQNAWQALFPPAGTALTQRASGGPAGRRAIEPGAPIPPRTFAAQVQGALDQTSPNGGMGRRPNQGASLGPAMPASPSADPGVPWGSLFDAIPSQRAWSTFVSSSVNASSAVASAAASAGAARVALAKAEATRRAAVERLAATSARVVVAGAVDANYLHGPRRTPTPAIVTGTGGSGSTTSATLPTGAGKAEVPNSAAGKVEVRGSIVAS